MKTLKYEEVHRNEYRDLAKAPAGAIAPYAMPSGFIFQRAVQSPTDHTARESVQEHRQEHEFVALPNVADVGYLHRLLDNTRTHRYLANQETLKTLEQFIAEIDADKHPRQPTIPSVKTNGRAESPETPSCAPMVQ